MTLQTPRLPSELLHQTIGNFNKATSLQDLKALCLASERLRAIAQPKLFETLRLSTLPLPNGEPRRAEGILQLFASRPESRNWTSELSVYGTDGAVVSGDPSTTHQESNATTRSVCLQMSGLQRIELLYFSLTSEMYRHLYYLPQLREVSLVGLSVAETPDITGRALALVKLSIQRCLENDDEPVVMSAHRALICPSLQTLTLDLRTADIVFKYVACDPSLIFPSLRSFNFNPPPEALPNLPSLLAFLRSCPNLFRFVLPANCIPYQGSPSDHGRGFAYQEDARGCAPKISSIHAPADLVRLLLPGRPISDVDAFLNLQSPLPLEESELESYRRGAVPLKKLSLGAVTWTHKSLEVLARLFPDLELLSLRVLGGNLSVSASELLGKNTN